MDKTILKTIEKIKKDHIRPDSRFGYLLRKYGKWFLFFLVASLGAISVGVIGYLINSLDWDLYLFTSQNRFFYFLSVMPYFWIVFIGIFTLLAFWEIRKTEYGYRYSLLKISILIFLVFSLLSLFAYFSGIGGKINSSMMGNFPIYGQHMVVTKESQWMQPSSGFLSGDVISVLGNELKIRDLNGKEWFVKLNNNSLVRPAVKMEIGQRIKMIGQIESGNIFIVSEIRPWMGKGMMNGSGPVSGGMRRGAMMR